MNRLIRFRKGAIALLILIGVGLWVWAGRGATGPGDQWIILPIVLLTAAFISRKQKGSFDRFWQILRDHRASAAVIIGVIAGLYFMATGASRELYPKYHDEFVYLTHAQMLAHGRLWMPPHPLADFFDSEYLIIQPVYTVQTWPGYALILAIGLWLHLPAWFISVLMSAAVVGLFFWIVAELLTEKWGLLAALLLVAVGPFRHQSVSVGAFGASLLFGMLMVIAWLKWSGAHALKWAMLFGIAAGWGAITRPVDAICFAAPLCVGAIFHSLGCRLAYGRLLRAATIAVASASPLIVLQLVFDTGVTGKWYQTQYLFYDQHDLPQVTFGFPIYDPSLRPKSHLIQKQIIYDQWAVPFVIQHQLGNALQDWIRNRLPSALGTVSPHPWLLILLPVGLLGLRVSRCWIVWLQIPIFLFLYGCYTVFLPQYAMVIAPALILMLLMGLQEIARIWPNSAIVVFLPVTVAGLALATLPQFTRQPEDPNPAPSVTAARQLPKFIHDPAVVLFRYQPWNNVHDEPVYNSDVAWPDDAPIIRAHDLGMPKDKEIFHYYAEHQPWRNFYLLDQGDNSLHFLGKASDLATQYGSPAPSQSIGLSR